MNGCGGCVKRTTMDQYGSFSMIATEDTNHPSSLSQQHRVVTTNLIAYPFCEINNTNLKELSFSVHL
jgi:hypothetical protein